MTISATPLAATRALGIALLLSLALVFGLLGASLTRAPPIPACLAGLGVVFLVEVRVKW